MMKRIAIIAVTAVLAMAASACTQQEQRTAGYGVGGAALGGLAGAAISGNGRGALVGAALGSVGGTFVGVAQTRNRVQYCDYRDSYGRLYQAPCN